MYIVSDKWILSQDRVDGQIQINISNTGTNADCTSYVRSAGLHCDSLMGEIPTTLKSHVLFFSYFFPTLLHFFNARVIIFSSSSFRDSTKWTHCDLLFAPASTSSHIQSCNHFRWYLTIFSSSPLLLSLKPLQPRSRFPTRLFLDAWSFFSVDGCVSLCSRLITLAHGWLPLPIHVPKKFSQMQRNSGKFRLQILRKNARNIANFLTKLKLENGTVLDSSFCLKR